MTRMVDTATGEVMEGDADGTLLEGLFVPIGEITPRQAAMVMVSVQRQRREQVAELEKLRREVARLRAVAETLKAEAQLTGQGTVEDRKAQGRLVSADAFFAVACAEAVAEAAYALLFILKDDWDTARSIGTNERAERNAIEGYGS